MRPIREILRFVSSMLTARRGLARIPFRERISRVAGLTRRPASVSINSTRWPASSFNFVRTDLGLVICPLLVIICGSHGRGLCIAMHDGPWRFDATVFARAPIIYTTVNLPEIAGGVLRCPTGWAGTAISSSSTLPRSIQAAARAIGSPDPRDVR